MKIAVLTSGGVDSSVALHMLKDQGHDLTAFYLKIWLEDELSYLGECPWEEDTKYIEEICEKLKIPFKIVSLQKEYWDQIIGYTISEVKAGKTPNPDILCNELMKFGAFYNKIDQSYEKVATGHYAQIKEEGGIHKLYRAPDPIKDQTYFLAYLKQKQLKRALFPIGHMPKTEVRELAEKYNLPNKNRKDSQGLCFLGKIKFRDFIKHHLGEKPGDIIHHKTGETLGEHPGFYYFTIGQRHGLKLSGGPWFVIDKDVKKNIIYVAPGYEEEKLEELKVFRNTFEVKKLNWITGKKPTKNELKLKIRHGPKIWQCNIEWINSDHLKVHLKEGDYSIAPGQFAVFYDDEQCLGGGVIQ